MDTAAQWPQDIVVKVPMEEKGCSSVERKVRPHKEQALNCPRCNSTNTKFCYYNNYSLSQPRYFCKTCRRYWTEGGSLRNIPVGGGSRKNNTTTTRSSSSSNSSSTTSSNSSNSKKLPDLVPLQPQNPKNINIDTQDLNLGFSSIHHGHINNNNNNNHEADLKAITEMIQVPNFENNYPSSGFGCGIRMREEMISEQRQNPNSSLELLTSTAGLSSSIRGLNNYAFMPLMPVVTTTSATADFGSGFPNLPEFKLSSLNFSLDHGLGSNYGSFQGANETNGNNSNNNNKLLFPFEDLKLDQSSNTNNNNDIGEHNRDHQNGDSTSAAAAGYWSGVIGGGGSW